MTENNSCFKREKIYQCQKAECSRLCNQQVYLVEPTQAQLDVVGEKTKVFVRIYFAELKYTEIVEDQLLNPSSFFANLGGVFGLCTGMSVVTIVQGLALCMEYLLSKSRRPANWAHMERAVRDSGCIRRLSWHGLLDLYLAKTWGWRLFWATTILCSCATFTFYCNGAYQAFMYNNTATGLSITPAKSALLPFIRFCHKEGRHNLTYIHQTLKSLNLSNDEATSNNLYHIISLYSCPGCRHRRYSGKVDGFLLFMKLFGKNSKFGLDLVDFLVNSSYSCQATFASCSFNSEPFDCCRNVQSYFTILGYCHQLDGLNGAMQRVPGHEGGASVHVKLHREEFLRATHLIGAAETSDNTLGVYFGESERLNLFEDSISLTPGTRNHVRLETEELHFIPGFEKKCNEVQPALLFTETQYSEQVCYSECLYNQTWQSCGCDLPMYYDGKNISHGVYCSPLDLAT
jgi:Amiloride-sensitive sodium channel